jgi:hypothetical protein
VGLLLGAALGCGDQPTRYPVSGKVMIDGEPLSMGTIRFVPRSGRPVSSAIMSNGSFVLSESSLSSSRLSDGVTPGVYRVSVSASKIINEDADKVQWLAPSQYADFRTSGIELEIDSPQDDLVVDLTWKGHDSDEVEQDEHWSSPAETDEQKDAAAP